MIPLPLVPKIKEKKGNKAVFEIEALYPGYGVTIGNTLRRVLLSSLPGVAVTQLKIEGVPHEFSTVPGIPEDVITIALNVKQMRFKMHTDEPQKAVLKVKGEKEVSGVDFKLPSQVELINKSCHIATLTSKSAALEMEIQIEKGIGFVPREMRKKSTVPAQGKLEIGVIPLDAIFTPVRQVSYRVENMRVGERTDFDHLTLEVETDGTIPPEDAFSQAIEILLKHFTLFSEGLKKTETGKSEKMQKPEEEKTEDDETQTKIEDLKLSQRTINALLKNNIKTVSGILRKNEKGLLELEGMGEKGVAEIKRALKKLNLEIKQE